VEEPFNRGALGSPARPTASAVPDPAPGSVAIAGAVAGLAGVLTAGITLTDIGDVVIACFEWLGSRTDDPASRFFLSA